MKRSFFFFFFDRSIVLLPFNVVFIAYSVVLIGKGFLLVIPFFSMHVLSFAVCRLILLHLASMSIALGGG